MMQVMCICLHVTKKGNKMKNRVRSFYKPLLAGIYIFVNISCGSRSEYVDDRGHRKPKSELQKLKEQVFQLQGTIAQINSFVANDFSDCSTGLPPFETKICEIAQTATAEDRVEYKGQLSSLVKVFQNKLFGEDCVNDTDVGCPVAGSISEELANISTYGGDISTLQTDVASLQTELSGIQTRLDDFDGSGNSVEVVINDIESRVVAIETWVGTAQTFEAISLCKDIAASGPLYETILRTGDKLDINAFIETGSGSGLGLFKSYGDGDGDVYFATSLNTKRCKVKIYEDAETMSLLVCWDNSNRNAPESAIDNVCDYAGGFASPASSCTCK